jgi:phosphoribosylamine--glycine ligase
VSIDVPVVLKPRRFLFWSHGGDADALALRVEQEGNEVLLYHVTPFARQKRLYDGLVPQAQTPLEAISWSPDVIIFDNIGEGKIADGLRARGWRVWGASQMMDRLEQDRAFGLALMRRNGLRIPETYVFKTAGEALPFLKDRPERWVLKPIGRGTTAHTYVSKNVDDLIHFLEKWQSTEEAKQPFLLQKVVDGIEISTEVWVQNGEIVWPANGTIELKKYGPGNLGPNIGSASSTCWVYGMDDPVIVRRGIGKMADWLKQQGYHGVLDWNSIVILEDRYPYGLEWTSRLGYSAIYALLEVTDAEVGRLLWDAANGTLRRFPGKPGVGYAVRVSIQPYPAAELYEGPILSRIMEPATGLDVTLPIDHPNIHPLDVRLDRRGNVETAGYDGVVAEVTGRGRSIEDARDAAHRTFEELVQVPNAFARIHDGADRAIIDTARLRTIGYETFREQESSKAAVVRS